MDTLQKSERLDFCDPENLRILESLIIRFEVAQHKTIDGSLEMGEILCEIKNRCDHGQFIGYINNRFHISKQTANGLMNLFKKWGGNAQKLEGLPVQIAIELSSPSVPEDITDRIIDDHKAGFTPTVRKAKAMIKEAKEDAKPAPEPPSEPLQNMQQLEPDEIDQPEILPDPEDEKTDLVAEADPEEKSNDPRHTSIIYILEASILEIKTSMSEIESLGDDEKQSLKKQAIQLGALAKRIIQTIDPKAKQTVIHDERITDEQAIELVEDLIGSIAANTTEAVPISGSMSYNRWLEDMKLLARTVERATFAEIKAVIAFIKTHGDAKFSWGKVIRSPKKLKDKYYTIRDQMTPKQTAKQKAHRIVVDDGKDWGNGDGRRIER